jgi:inosose dehydratase
MVTRREFLSLAGIACAGGFGRTVHAASSMRFGYAAITWGNDVPQAIDDIAAVGFRGIQLRAGDGTVARYSANPAALHDLLAQHHLEFAVLSSGNLATDPARERETLEMHVKNAQFLRAAGGSCLQVIDERPKGRALVADDYARVGRLLTELGKRVTDAGVTLVYHHHMNSTGEKPQEVKAVLDAADKRHVRLLFDVAHYQQGGGDPVAAIRQYRDWIDVVHLKDVRDRSGGSARSGGSDRSRGSAAAAAPTYEFVELGRGRVDLPGVFRALADINFSKWAIVELDRVPDGGGTPKQSAEMNRKFIVEHGFAM